MVRKKAILYLEEIHCIKDSGDGGGDDIYLIVYGDGNKLGRYPTGQSEWTMNSGETDRIDLEIECTYYDEITVDIWEADGDYDGGPHKKDDFQGTAYIQRTDPLPSNHKDTRTVNSPTGNAVYEISFRVISDPIPTVRVLGIYCEQDSDGMDGGVVNAIADMAIACTKAAGKVLTKSPRPSRQLMGDAMLAASKAMKGAEKVVGWLKEAIEGADDVYIKHLANTNTRGYDGAFFPPDQDTYGMESGDEVHFEEKYGHYFRFPLDEGKVTIEFREKDPGPLKDIIIGSIIIDPEQIKENSTVGIGGGSPDYGDVTSIEGGAAVYDGPAVVEVANSYYGRQGGAGAIYYICYSVGTENWLLPATTAGQGDPDDEVPPESISGHFTAPRGPVDYADAQAGCQEQQGVLPTVEELDLMITSGWIPESWPKGNYWLAENFYMDIETKLFNSIVGDTNPPGCWYSCKQSNKGNGVEGWDGVYGITLSSPDGMVGYDTASANVTSQDGKLPTAELLNDMARAGTVPANWPQGPYWISEGSMINLPEGGQHGSEYGPAYYTVKKTGFDEDKFYPWEGIGGYYAFPHGLVNYDEAVSGSQFVGGALPTLAHFRILIDQGMIPASWPKDNYYWTANKHWVNITDIHDSGTSGDGSQNYYYTSFIPDLADEVETIESFEAEHRYFASPMGPVALDEAKQICQARGGELPTLETLRLMVEQNQIPENWPKDKYYYTDNGYMVDISALEGKDMIIKSEDGDHPCYFTCEVKKPTYDSVAHGAFGPPQYLADLAYAESDCIAKDSALPSLEDMLSLIEQDRIPENWRKGLYWAAASTNTPFCVDIETGDYWYSETGKEVCFYSCHKADAPDGLEDWQPGKGLYLIPENEVTFTDAQAACEAQGGELPSLQEMQLIFQQFEEEEIPNTWPTGDEVYYWTAEGKVVDSQDYTQVITPEASGSELYHFTCKRTGTINGLQTGYEIKDGHYYYTLPFKKATYKEAVDACLYYGGELATMEHLSKIKNNGLAPGKWPTSNGEWYLSRDNYLVDFHRGPQYNPDLANDPNEYWYTCRIKESGYIEEMKGYFTSPLRLDTDPWSHCHEQGGTLPTLTEMLTLIEKGLIPDNWPSDYPYWVDNFHVDIKTGEYVYDTSSLESSYYYSCKLESEDLQVERFCGVDAFYTLPNNKQANYSQAFDACRLNGGQLPSVAELRGLIKHGNVPSSWPAGNYWVSGGYYMNIQDGTFTHSLLGDELCYFTCRIVDWGRVVATGEEVEFEGNVYFTPQGEYDYEDTDSMAKVENGTLPSKGDLQRFFDQGMAPENWPSGLYAVSGWLDWVNKDDGLVEHGNLTGYSTAKVPNPNGYKLTLDIEELS